MVTKRSQSMTSTLTVNSQLSTKKMYTLKKSLGQHFLHDENMCKHIVAQLRVREGMNVLEIGPGGGAITKYLLQLKNINYKAIEIDEEKVNYLLQTFPEIEGKLIHQDFLKSEKPFDGNFTVIGNFPYNISSQIMFKIYEWEDSVEEVIGMFQKEVAQRIAAKNGGKDYGILSVLIQSFFAVDYLFDVPPQCFTPPPKVMSGVIRLHNNGNPNDIVIKRRDSYRKLVKAAFGQRRKTLRNALKGNFDTEFLQNEIFNKRAEQLTIEQFVFLLKSKYSDA